MNDVIETIAHGKYTIEIYPSEAFESPRDEDHLSTMICFSRRYDLGDKHDYKPTDYSGLPELTAAILKKEKPVIFHDLWKYEHGGIVLKTGSFDGMLPQGHARFDSCQIGFILVTPQAIRERYGHKRITKADLERAECALQSEITEYNQYLNGEIYGFSILDEAGETVDSRGGYYGFDNCIEAAKEAAGEI